MGFFSRRRIPNLLSLIKLPKEGEPIEFDEEEQAAIDEAIERFVPTIFDKDSYYPEEVVQPIVDGCGRTGLYDVVWSRLSGGDFPGAAQTCLKLLGVAPKIEQPLLWLLLAEIHAKYGDMVHAKAIVKTAEESYKMNPGLSESFWEERVRRVEGIIKSKRGKMTFP